MFPLPAASSGADEHSSPAQVARPIAAPSKMAEQERVTAQLKRQAKADEYRIRALGASALAAGSILERVREKHELAAASWLALAELNRCDATPAARNEDVPLNLAFTTEKSTPATDA